MHLGIAIVLALLAGGPSAGRLPVPANRPADALTPAPSDLRYAFPVGDVLVYERVFDTENSPLDHPDVKYTVHEEWLIKTAVVNRNSTAVGTAIQANRTKLRITGRAALVRALGESDADNILSLYERAETTSVRYRIVDEFGRSLNRSYSLQDAASFVVSSMKGLFILPTQSIWEGWSTTPSGDQPMDIVYEGVKKEGSSFQHVFSGRHPAGWALMAVDRDLGLPARFEYAADYGGAGERRREHASVRLKGVQRDAWHAWDKDPMVDRALVLGAITDAGLTCRAGIIKRFLAGSDVQEQNLAAAYCARRGIPDGLDMKRYLYARNPIVRFNAAKALSKFGGDARPLIAKIRDADPYVARRAADYFNHSTDVLPPDKKFVFWVLQNWLYEGGELPDLFQGDEESLRDLLRFLKPANDAVGGCYRYYLPGEPTDFRHPYYVSLPEDYDPAETYPMIVYLGMGDGRGDLAFQAIYNGLRAAGALSHFILLVPQADGKWWDKDVEPVVNRVLTAALKTLSVDTNQVFLAGSSNGGMGTIYFGTRLPDRFAGLAANMGYPVVDRRFLEQPQNLEVLKNLTNARVFLSHGAQDDQVTPEGDRRTADILRQADGQVTQRVMPGRKHNIDIREVIAEILDVFASGRRNAYPRRIDFVLADAAYPRCFWIEAEGAPAGAEIHAAVTGNTLVDLTRDVVVRVNGREAYRGPVKPSADDLLFSLAMTADAQAAYGACLEIDMIN
ncbi:MAG: hypothetical protein NTZ26_02925 [Candidatus Aminicenantes bacterium]|nr:hypothetical protein [Candidatus Aminicenantes bacterium]